ncbi:DNA-binding transcriptional regulator, GntR family [Pilibacter termitis]|uniref:DNA-binding transcriptional regulator, GntR family n=1 Tax=Pilibacter termitis TaxID=263852 RepID=A0A1T4NXE3_9ENTE|nr:GntR family transcriptional regulator [Pilibacter termitis]SJZ83895.1 DNA-binding transcriptional regulator, GntR family [Pilibacter termitis]
MKGILYQEISDQLKRDIINKKYPVDSLFPTENDLVEMFSVSKITIRKAVELLAQEGYLHKQSGKGTRVISNRPFNVLSKAHTYTKLLEDEGIKVENKVVYVGKCKGVPHEFRYEDVYEIHRIYYLDGEAAIFMKHYFSLTNDKGLPKKEDKNFSFYSFLADRGLYIDYIKDSFRALRVEDMLKEQLQLSDDIALERKRYAYDNRGKLIEYTISIYDSSKQEYFIDYQV